MLVPANYWRAVHTYTHTDNNRSLLSGGGRNSQQQAGANGQAGPTAAVVQAQLATQRMPGSHVPGIPGQVGLHPFMVQPKVGLWV